jgi:hypothetical protein
METGNAEASLKQADCAELTAGADPEKRSGVWYLRAMMSIHANDMDAARHQLAEAVSRDPAGQYAALAKREIERLQPLLAASR